MGFDGITCDSTTLETFCLRCLSHFTVASLSEQIGDNISGQNMGGILSNTFDGGYRDDAVVAAPILRQITLPTKCFQVTELIGTECMSPWDASAVYWPRWVN